MDFGGLASLLCSDTTNNSLISALDLDQKHKFKQEQSLSGSGSATVLNHDEWREMKVPRISQEEDISKGMLLQQQQQQRSSCSVFDGAQNMLSFSEPNTHLTNALPYYARKNVGYGVRGVLAGVRGPFTASQWMELEHQALIYKYITVNAPIPSNLLIPIRKALETAAFCYPGANLRHTAYGWGGFHMGFSNNSDPEPGRCRRTDGKKWRCSRDAVADQKYCERHMNRGRHRSRKPVEGQPGHSVSNGPTATATANAAVVSTPTATTAATGISHLSQQNQHQFGRSFLKTGDLGSNKIQDSSSHSMLSASSIGLKPTAIPVPSEFGLVTSDSLLNPLQKNDNADHKPQNSLHQFMDDWPHPDKSNFISSNSSPNSERLNLSPLRMGLGVGNTTAPNVFDERSQAVNWIPVSWETSSGGPLGEVLNHNTNNGPSALNLMTDGWDSSQQMTLSPTGVLQKTGFGCFSNSSAGSSPRTDNSLVGSTLITSSSLPLL
ncbi:putative transcription factor interactor and regulator C3H-WRC/GRF family [Helianthus annuus]|nr:putative transcription factor interactor and regulator C3H-WRC/GRF family [Helianthus annuus]